jgi:hypothetical protein
VAVFLGTPLFANLVDTVLGPGLAQATQITVAFAGIGLGMNPNGLIPAHIRRHWDGVLRTPMLAAAFVAVVVGVWLLDVSNKIDNWTFAIASVAILGALPVVSSIVTRRRRGETNPTEAAPRRPTRSAPGLDAQSTRPCGSDVPVM